MTQILLKEFINIFVKFPFNVFDKEALRTYWISGFADVDDQVTDHFSTIRKLDVFKDLPQLLEEACRVTENLVHQCENLEEPSVCDSDDVRSEISETGSGRSGSTDVSESAGSGPWSALVRNGVRQQPVLSFLFVFLESEYNSAISVSDKKLCLLSARLYLDLLCLPGCKAFGIFQNSIFQNAINCLTIKDNARPQNKKQNVPSSNRGRKVRPAERGSDNSEDESTASTILPTNEQKQLIMSVLISLESVFEFVSLHQHQDVISTIVDKLVEFSSYEPERVPAMSVLGNPSQGSRLYQKCLSSLAYRNLILLCNPRHSDLHKLFCQIFVAFLPSLTMQGAGNAQTIPRHLVLVKDKTAEYIQYLIQNFCPDIVPATRILIQKVSMKLADRAEFRTKISQMLVSIANCLPIKEQVSVFQWYHKLSRNTKASHRVFALEVFSLLLLQPEGDKGDLPEDISHAGLLKAVVERCDDKSPVVSAKAMSILSNNQSSIGHLLSDSNGLDCNAVIDLLIASCGDEKSTIRKASIQLLECFICKDAACLKKENLQVIGERVQDMNVSVQKQASVSMNKILDSYPESSLAQDVWLEAQLSLVYADESSVQEKGLEAMEEVLLQKMFRDKQLAWTLLEKISDGAYQDKQQNLRRAYSIWIRENKFRTRDLIKLVKQKLDGCYESVVWMLLTFLTPNQKVPELDFVVNATLDEMNKPAFNVVVLRRKLQVISQTAQYLPEAQLRPLLNQLEVNCQGFLFPVQVLSMVFQAMEKLFFVVYGEGAEGMQSLWCSSMSKEIDGFFANTIMPEHGQNTYTVGDEETLARSIFIVGEIFQLCPWHLPSKFKHLIHSLVIRPTAPQDSFLPSSFPLSSPAQPGSVSVKIKAHALITLGKLCIGDREFCKTAILTSVKELHETTEPCIRNNVVLALLDLMVFHPTLVEPYITNVTACLQDDSEFVRRQTLVALAKLLKEDYIKWKGTLFYRILLCCVDESPEIVSMAEYCLLHLLLKRQPQAFGHHFVECIYYLNAYTENQSFNQFPLERNDDIRLFSLKNDQQKRLRIYKFLLRNMPDQERFGLHSRLCQDILGALLDNVLPLNQDTSGLIKDGLVVLSCEEIKLSPLAGIHEDLDDDADAAALHADAKKAVTNMIRKEVVRGILPIVVSFKIFLENARSPLIGDMEVFLREFLKDFKNELKDIVGENGQLANEIAFIIRSTTQPGESDQHENSHSRTPRVSIGNLPPPEPRPPRVSTVNLQPREPSPTRVPTGILQPPEPVNGAKQNGSTKTLSSSRAAEASQVEKPPSPPENNKRSLRKSSRKKDSVSSKGSIEDTNATVHSNTKSLLTSTPHAHSTTGGTLFQTSMDISDIL